jgi:hypothetical protein
MLATNAGLLTPILGDPSPWNPERLYINGEAGAWYDPGDLTAEKVAWRRNLLTWTQEFDNAAWVKADATVTANAGVAPDGTTTADKLVENTAANVIHRLQASVSLGGSVDAAPYVFSIYAKADGRSIIRIYDNNQNTSGVSFFDLSAGTVVSGTGSIVSFGNGWYRCSVFPLRNFSTTAVPRVELVQSGTTVQYTGDGTSGVLLWGAQLELGTTASAYQRITDFTSDFLAAFPTHALYQDSAGTTPVTALGQPVGLALDKSRGALANIGAELITNGDFSSGTTGWSFGPGWSVVSGAAAYGGASGTQAIQQSCLTLGRFYQLRFTVTAVAGSAVANSIYIGDTNLVFNGTLALGTYTFYGVATGGTGVFIYGRNGQTISIDNVSVREVPGVHAIQATSASRPALDARVNLLTYSEQFDNAIWSVQGSTVTANSTVAPDGTTTADTLVETATTEDHNRFQGISAVGGALYRGSVYLKKGLSDWAALYIVNGTTGNGVRVWFNISTGTVGTSANIGSGLAGVSFAIEAAANGYYRCFLTATADGSTSLFRFYVALARSNGGAPSYAGDITYNMAAWGADFRLATDAAYPYQRVVTATDYADVGVPRSFLHDGFDDSSYTASSLDLSGTDKVTVWAGVYKNSDATGFGIIVETGDRGSTRAGSFSVTAPAASATPRYLFALEGSSATEYQPETYAAPISNVLSAQMDLAGALRVDELVPRVNGIVRQTNAGGAASAGTGNLGNYVLYMGRRNNASLPFNGKIYTIIIRGGVTDAATLALTERYVGSRMGIVL